MVDEDDDDGVSIWEDVGAAELEGGLELSTADETAELGESELGAGILLS